MKKIIFIAGWHQSGKTAFLSKNIESNNVEFIKINEDANSFKLIGERITNNVDVYVKLLYIVRDPRISWGLSIDRMHRLNSIKTTDDFVESIIVAEEEIQKLNIETKTIKFNDYIENKNIINDFIGEKIEISHESAQQCNNQLVFTKIDIDWYITYLAYFYSIDTIVRIENKLSNIIKKYKFDLDSDQIISYAQSLTTQKAYDKALFELKYRFMLLNCLR